MGSRCGLIFLAIFSAQHAFCYSGDPVMYLPPFEVRAMRDGRQPGGPAFVPEQPYPGNRGPASQFRPQQILHTSQAPVPPSKPVMREKQKIPEAEPINFGFDNLEVPKDDRQEVTNKNERTELSDRRSAYDYPPPSYGYQPLGYPSYGHESHEQYVPPSHHTGSKLSLLKPDLGDLVKPVSTKVAGKVSGLIGLVLALLTGSAPNDLELKGFKDIIINGIVKPLLVAKGGIKSLISKLTIPVISILLINLEVLVTIWWLWEDCSEHTAPPQQYSYPQPSYGYNSYQ